jgi:hypothetical protein
MHICIFAIYILMFTFILMILFFYTARLNNSRSSSRAHTTPIYCLMITGKDDRRRRFASTSVTNFKLQSYTNKYLIIVNEGSTSCLNDEQNNDDSILELHVQKSSLGELRNIALSLVPHNAIWTTWDDDDWRSTDYLLILKRMLQKHDKKYLMFCNRLDHNLLTNFTYRVNIPTGTYIFFAYKDPHILYDHLDTKEDIVVKRHFIDNKESLVMFENNDPKIYVRFIHDNNTSLFVDKNKRSVSSNSSSHMNESYGKKEDILYVSYVKKMYYT